MDSKLQLFAKVLLKEHYDEFLEMIQLFNIDKRTFVLQHRKMFEKGWYDTSSEDNEFSEVDIMLCFAIVSHRMAVIDWSGEEYSGQVKRSITMMLKNYGIERFLWNTKKFEDSLDWDKIRRGDYLPLLFQAMNKQLNRGGYSIVFCDTKSDCFRYAILPTAEFVQFENTELDDYLTIISPKIYNIYLADKGNELPKIMLYLKKKFSKRFKEFNIIAEESDNSNIEFNNSIIIDPIDGTTNFVNGVPHTAISVGVYKNKKPYLAIVYNPILDELYTAKIGKGAFLNGKKLKVSHEDNFQKSLIATGFPYTSSSNEADLTDVVKKIKDVLPLCQDLRRLGSASLDLCYVAKGTFDGYYEMNLRPWDVSAGILIVTEAGGKISNINGDEYTLFEDKFLVASNGKIHNEFIKNLNL